MWSKHEKAQRWRDNTWGLLAHPGLAHSYVVYVYGTVWCDSTMCRMYAGAGGKAGGPKANDTPPEHRPLYVIHTQAPIGIHT
jgi:hypothetical protein